MKLKIIFVFLLIVNTVYAQETDSISNLEINTEEEAEEAFVTHTVKKGETIALIYKKYLVDPKDIYKLNKEAVDGIKEGMVLKVPVSKFVKTEKTKEGIEKVYQSDVKNQVETGKIDKVYVSEIKEQSQKGTIEKVYQPTPIVDSKKNTLEKVYQSEVKSPNNETGLEKVYVSGDQSVDRTTASSNEALIPEVKANFFHIVQKNETLFSIAKSNHLTVDQLRELNPDIVNNTIVIGQKLTVSKSTENSLETNTSTEIVILSGKNIVEATDPNDPPSRIIHIVKPKETLYSLSKMYGVTIEEIKNLNPILQTKVLLLGQELIIKN